MENYHSYEKIIKRLASKPVCNVEFQTSTVVIHFEDGEKQCGKLDLALRLFLMSNQNIQFIRKVATEACIHIPLDKFSLLGWRTGDCVAFHYKNVNLFIQFS